LFSLTIVILSTFLVELSLLMAALGGKFFSHLFYVIDLVVVATSFTFEIVFHSLSKDALQDVVGMFVIFRLWRFIRIGHGIVEVTAEASAEKHERINEERDKRINQERDERIDELTNILIANNISVPSRIAKFDVEGVEERR
jgi:hypothetical protein